ncbi:MAG: hypothetical protein A2033_15965 [Bacteroidetes bacterium GWA2_31_9]|nr:MAG: hypothetical protein A2033_15965 [Bacteroidetes bacterium GWA2_31_9]
MTNLPPRIIELLEIFYTDGQVFQNLSPYTIRGYKRVFSPFLSKFTKVQEIHQLTQDVIEKFILEGTIQRKWEPATIVNYTKAFKAFGKWCVKKGYIAENPANSISKPRLNKSLPKALDKEKAELIINTAYNLKYHYRFPRFRNRALVAIMIMAGLRVRECLNLKLNDIDFQNDVIFVNNGKGKKDRFIPMCGQLKIYLQAYLKERERLNRSHIYFFSSSNKDKPLTESGVKRLILILRDKLGFHFHSHILRHTFATLMLEGGCDIFSLSKMLGHNDIKTTAIYLSATAEHLKSQIIKHPLNNFR